MRPAASYAQQVNPGYTFTDRALVETINDLAMTISVYTVEEPQDMLRMISYSVSGIITDFPEILNRVRFSFRGRRFRSSG